MKKDYELEDFLFELGMTAKVALDELVSGGKTMAVCQEGCEVGTEEYCKHGKPSLLIALRSRLEEMEKAE